MLEQDILFLCPSRTARGASLFCGNAADGVFLLRLAKACNLEVSSRVFLPRFLLFFRQFINRFCKNTLCFLSIYNLFRLVKPRAPTRFCINITPLL